eukprot:TRINITY_DN21019_c0_g1_i1.p1 TRINITY_DN21019_c0_g1~~TRINITY_DN21019_c0_g1_i1.p1  ORF type:complete len:253 (+),score=38.98 TRINITY_DN21019_c0_g1_i1:45-803(+)
MGAQQSRRAEAAGGRRDDEDLAGRLVAAYEMKDKKTGTLTMFEYAALEVDMGRPLLSPKAFRQACAEHESDSVTRAHLDALLDGNASYRKAAAAALDQRLRDGAAGGITGYVEPVRGAPKLRRGGLTPKLALCRTIGGRSGEVPHCPTHRVPMVFDRMENPSAPTPATPQQTAQGGGSPRRAWLWSCRVCQSVGCGAHWRCPEPAGEGGGAPCEILCCTLCCPHATADTASERLRVERARVQCQLDRQDAVE